MFRNGKTGVLVTFEGIANSGKATQMKLLVDSLTAEGKPLLATREPFIELTRIAEVLVGASKLHTHGDDDTLEKLEKYHLSKCTDVFLFAADRAEHVDKVIYPALRKGRIVLVDRYLHSSLAYQSYGGVGTEWISSVNHFAPKPDLIIYLKITPEESTKRQPTKGKEKPFQRYAKDDIEDHACKQYDRMANEGTNWFVVDGMQSIEKIQEEIKQEFDDRFSRKTSTAPITPTNQ